MAKHQNWDVNVSGLIPVLSAFTTVEPSHRYATDHLNVNLPQKCIAGVSCPKTSQAPRQCRTARDMTGGCLFTLDTVRSDATAQDEADKSTTGT